MRTARTRFTEIWLPLVCYAVAAALFLGTAAFLATNNMPADQPNKDIWQHVAALHALMDDLANPANPFVATDETSRHFHPLWVGLAALAQTYDLSVWAALRLASYLSMGLFAGAVYFFARTYFVSPWAPLVLLVTLLFGWMIQVQHTGAYSYKTLLFGAAYPATFLISFSLGLWAVVIRALARRIWLGAVILLVALMFATHQLGAVIGLIGAGCFILLWPGAGFAARVAVSLAVLGGLGLSLFWPYYNPVFFVVQSGDFAWTGSPDYYGLTYLTVPFVPAILGVLGLRGVNARPLALALGLYLGLFLLGLAGVQVASRFLFALLLVLHIGLAGYLLAVMAAWLWSPRLKTAAVAAASVGVLVLYVASVVSFQADFEARRKGAPDTYVAALELTRDIPDTAQIAAYDMTAWPIAATGQAVLSVPWPEPGIHDLVARRDATRALFDPALSRDQRRALAQQLDVRWLVTDTRILPAQTLSVLAGQAEQTLTIGRLQRFDLFD